MKNLIKNIVEPLNIERLFKEAKSLKIHGIVLVFVVIRHKEKGQFLVSLAQLLGKRYSINFLHLNIQESKVIDFFFLQNLSRISQGGDGIGDMMVSHVFLYMNTQGVQIGLLIITNQDSHKGPRKK